MCTIRVESKTVMELECLKFNEKMKAEGAYCRHPDDYCKYRTSCIIFFMEKENRKAGNSPPAKEIEKNPNDPPVNNG